MGIGTLSVSVLGFNLTAAFMRTGEDDSVKRISLREKSKLNLLSVSLV